jgi:hypothetical protein
MRRRAYATAIYARQLSGCGGCCVSGGNGKHPLRWADRGSILRRLRCIFGSFAQTRRMAMIAAMRVLRALPITLMAAPVLAAEPECGVDMPHTTGVLSFDPTSTERTGAFLIEGGLYREGQLGTCVAVHIECLIAVRPGEGPLSDHTADVQPKRREPLFMPRSGPRASTLFHRSAYDDRSLARHAGRLFSRR